MNQNGQMWYDTDGQPIQAHGGMILEHKGIYYWYGENKNGPTARSLSGDIRVDFIGISCYSSADCMNWRYEGLVLEASLDPSHPLYKDRVGERPKVLYNEKTGKFVMWFHLDSSDYMEATAGVAQADSPTGPFQYLHTIRPNSSDCRDMTLFLDIDKKAYLIHSADWNKTLCISQLTDDFLDVNGIYGKAFIDQSREAPALFFHKGLYYMITSGCTGWKPNSALFAVSRAVLSGWKLIDNPCVGVHARQTFFGQGSHIFEKSGRFYLLLDHWNHKDLKASGYSILPIDIQQEYLTISFCDYTDLS